ncbi:GGDEF domain-containing protein [Paenalkalicoccus suaedae]|uniref:GGDEF domain-containing protein n=1 Tax=Paenalkalicoccus suaedae TaxID=2592382 RepID=A0A859FK35_9BACI|nr:GGDEF domain-containing protein [Paenalkalicoccus suaedae]
MEYVVQFQLNIYALLILGVLHIIMLFRSKVASYSKRLLQIIMAVCALSIILEPATWIFDGKQFFGAFALEYGTNFLLFLIGPVLGGLLLSYVDYHLFKRPKRLRKRLFYQQASIFTFIVLLANIFYPIYYRVDPITNSFNSGAFKEVHYLALASLYVYMLVMIIKNRTRTSSYVRNIFVLFFLLPIVGMVVQMFDSRLYFSWTSIVIGILAAYVFLESTSAELDFLTKLYNRQSYEQYMNHLIEKGKPFQAILLDLDNFKEINDQYGHDKGDQVLLLFSSTLKTVFHTDAFVARLGGDEFVVIRRNLANSVELEVEKVHRHLQKLTDSPLAEIGFSYGCHTMEAGTMTKEELYTTIDQHMYEHKRSRRQAAHHQDNVTI